MKRLLIPALALLPIAAFGATTVSAQDEARVRVLHASPDAPAVDIYVNGSEAISDLAFSEITDYVPLAAGDYEVEVFPAEADGSGEPVISASLSLDPNTDYTVAAVGQVAAIEPLVLVDDNTLPAAGQAHLRFVHASPDAPAVDIAAEGAGVVVPNAAFKDASGYLPLPAGTYDLSVLAAGTDTVALDLPGITLEEGTVYTAFAIGLLEGEPALTAKLVVDARTAPEAPSTGTGLAVTDSPGFGPNLAIAAGLGVIGVALATLLAAKALTRPRMDVRR